MGRPAGSTNAVISREEPPTRTRNRNRTPLNPNFEYVSWFEDPRLSEMGGSYDTIDRLENKDWEVDEQLTKEAGKNTWILRKPKVEVQMERAANAAAYKQKQRRISGGAFGPGSTGVAPAQDDMSDDMSPAERAELNAALAKANPAV